MSRLIFALIALVTLAVTGPLPALAEAPVGVVLLHGKDASPPYRQFERLEAALSAAGIPVEEPEMPWSRRRGYDVSYQQAMVEIDAAVARLKARGVSGVVVAGHSLGANAAIGYGARHRGLKGIVALATGHLVDQMTSAPFQDSLARAKAMVAAGHGGDSAVFSDRNHGQTFERTVAAGLYISYFDPAGDARVPENVAKLSAPLLWVGGASDPLSKGGPGYAFTRAPANPRNSYVTVAADHMGTPAAAADLVVTWLKGL